MLSPEILDQFLAVLRRNNVMSACLESGGDKIAVTLGPEFPSIPDESPVQKDSLADYRMPGGWKTEPSDPHDPDPLGLGTLDMQPAEVEVEGTEL